MYTELSSLNDSASVTICRIEAVELKEQKQPVKCNSSQIEKLYFMFSIQIVKLIECT